MIQFIIELILIGFFLWVIEALVPMDATVKRIIQVVILLCVILFVCHFFGVL